MQISITDNDVLTPVYFCGKRGESLDVQEHGVTYSVWKLLDDFDKHRGKSPKVVCKICHGEQAAFDKLIAAMTNVGNAAKDTANIFAAFAEKFNKGKKGKA